MSSTVSKETFSKDHYQKLIIINDSSITLLKPSNSRSELWSKFSQLHHLNIAQNYIVCNLCRVVLKWSSETGTRVMKNHNCENKPTPKSSTTPSRQRTISSYMPPPPDNYSSIKDRVVEACVEFCALDGNSFETVAGEGFVNLAKQLMNAGALIGTGLSVSDLLPHPTTVSRNVDRVYNRLKDQLINFCQKVEHFTITCDFWSAPFTGLHYGGISLHFVDDSFSLRIFVLACKLYDLPNQKAYNIRDFVNTTVEQFGLKINEDVFVVSDNEPKMCCAFREGTTRVGCSAHYINKVIEHAFELNDSPCAGVKILFTIVRDLISYIRQSHKQSSLSVCVQNYCKTRFSSVYLMLNTFVQVYNELPSLLNNSQRESYLKISYTELEQLTKYLRHFHDVIEKLSCELTPTIHLVIPYKQLLINRSTKNDDDHQNLIQLKRYLVEHLKTYWIISDIHYVAMLLHPNLKSCYLIPSKKAHAIQLLKSEVDKSLGSVIVHPLQTTTLNNNNNKVRRNMHVADSLDEIYDIPANENYLQKPLIEKSELDLYLADETRIDNNMNLLTYWDLNKSLYPILARIAKRILAVPATNTSVERLFSHSGNTITNRRTRLDADKVNQLLFIKRNIRILKGLYPSAVEQCTRRKNSSASDDATPSTTPNKNLQLIVGREEINQAIADEDSGHDQF
ncbi:unnamed protein product [Adineta steineri]|uniref:BED-type domain-containing protein n=1 Tax=Adineta steineri TaxID=433720 RepID=A0A815UEJ6_9BILA|nr:unnamed protein product [Adineta steineri]CAF3841157.1 unnamed protein product [Adineta steineri]